MSIQRVSSNTQHWKYDVYVSYNGEEDIQNKFTDHLYTNLEQRGAIVFRGDNDPNLENQAIEESRFLIVIFSRYYAHSTQRLDELVKIVHCMERGSQTVIPIFYHVEPSDVKKQKGNFQEAFARYEETFENKEMIQSWRKALTKMATLAGWPCKERRESKFIEEIVEYISNRLHPSGSTFMNLKEVLVGVKSCLEKLGIQAEANLRTLQWGPTIRNYYTAFWFFF